MRFLEECTSEPLCHLSNGRASHVKVRGWSCILLAAVSLRLRPKRGSGHHERNALQTAISSLPSLRSIQSQETELGWSLNLQRGTYHLRLASSEADRIAAFRLRFLVFNLELNEGLEAAYATGQDTDDFDSVCDHLIVGIGRKLLPVAEDWARRQGCVEIASDT